MLEILMYQLEPRVVNGIGQGIGVLVKSIEVPIGSQVRQDSTRVAATPKGGVHIGPVRTNVQILDAFIEHHRLMVHRSA